MIIRHESNNEPLNFAARKESKGKSQKMISQIEGSNISSIEPNRHIFIDKQNVNRSNIYNDERIKRPQVSSDIAPKFI